MTQTVNTYGTFPDKIQSERFSSERTGIYGLNFPLGKYAATGGYFKKTTGISMIRDAVKQLLLTEKGERLMLPNYGCRLKKFLFQPLDENTFTQIKDEIKFAFSNYIVGADLLKVAVFPTGDTGPAGGNSLNIILTLRYNEDETKIFDVEAEIQ